jgi:hypothetical protein
MSGSVLAQYCVLLLAEKQNHGTQFILFDGDGVKIAECDLSIPCGGSHLWHYSELFDSVERDRAGDQAYTILFHNTHLSMLLI